MESVSLIVSYLNVIIIWLDMDPPNLDGIHPPSPREDDEGIFPPLAWRETAVFHQCSDCFPKYNCSYHMTLHMHNINAMKYSWARGPKLCRVTGDTGGGWVMEPRSVIRLRYTTGFHRQPRMISKAMRLLLNVKCVCVCMCALACVRVLEEMRQVKGKFADRWSCQVSCQVCVWLMRG